MADDAAMTAAEVAAMFGLSRYGDIEATIRAALKLEPSGVHKYKGAYHPVYRRGDVQKKHDEFRKQTTNMPAPAAPASKVVEMSPRLEGAPVNLAPVLQAIAESERRILDKLNKETTHLIDAMAEIDGKMAEFNKHMAAFLKHLQEQAAKKP